MARLSGGARVADLVAAYGSPLYLYYLDIARARARYVQEALATFDVLYAAKANPNQTVTAALVGTGLGVEVTSAGELAMATAAGARPDQVVVVGPAKSDRTIEQAVRAGVRAVVVESRTELGRVQAAARRIQRLVRVALRVNIADGTPSAAEHMAGGPSRFGVDEHEVAAMALTVPTDWVTFVGIHAYAGSQILDEGEIAAHIGRVFRVADRVEQAVGAPLSFVDVGGGFGVPYGPGDKALDLDVVARLLREAGLPPPRRARPLLELGRYLVAPAGWFLTTVVDVKRSGGRAFAICDGGINNFLRPALTGVDHGVVVADDRGAQEPTEVFEVCGPLCTPLDTLSERAVLPQRLAPGWVLAVPNAGAYGYSMSPHGFLSQGAPAEVAVRHGRPHLVRARLDDAAFAPPAPRPAPASQAAS